MGKRNDKVYAINRHLTVYAFFLVRILPIPVYWYTAGWGWVHNAYQHCDLPVKLIMVISGVALDYLNIGWFIKLSKGLSKKLRLKLRGQCVQMRAKFVINI